MDVRWLIRTTLGVLLLGPFPLVGCGCGGGGSSENGPAEEPNIGPGGPPGVVKGATSKPASPAPKK